MALMDTFFISHGDPTLAIDETVTVRKFFQSWQLDVFRDRPKAILVISAHWETTRPTVNIVDRNDTIHDFTDFPKPLYQIAYNSPGAPKLAMKVKELLMASGFEDVEEDIKRGLDHGAWIPLMFMYPEADIPVCQLSIQTDRDATHHYNMGKALAPLREEGVLIIGSGSAVHNLDSRLPDGSPFPPWAKQFDTWLTDALIEGRYEDVNQYESKAPDAKRAHPEPDHFYPLHVAMGAAGEHSKAKLVHHSWTHGTLSYSSYQFTTPR